MLYKKKQAKPLSIITRAEVFVIRLLLRLAGHLLKGITMADRAELDTKLQELIVAVTAASARAAASPAVPDFTAEIASVQNAIDTANGIDPLPAPTI